MATTFFRTGRPTVVLTNIPGRSVSAAFATVACNWTLRVSASTSGFTVVMRPRIAVPGNASLVTRTGRPTPSRGSSCWGRAKLT